jgi:zinc protease
MAAVLGGGFTSRINMNLREAKGYSYGARGGFSYTKTHGAFVASAPVAGNATYQAILELDREIKGLWAGKRELAIKPDELEREKRGAVLGLPGRFATAQAALGQYRALVYFGLPLDYYDSYVAHIAKVSVADAMAAAARHLRPGQAVYVVVGNGDEKLIVREPDGAHRTLREALVELAASGDVGSGGLVELDADGRVK